VSDHRLQTLRRRWLETGAHEHEADYLRERVRHGELSVDRVALAAYLGHPAAGFCGQVQRPYLDRERALWEESAGLQRQLAGHPKPAVHPGNHGGLIYGLAPWGKEALLRAAAAVAWLAAPVLEVGLAGDYPVGEVLEQVQRAAIPALGDVPGAVAALDLLYGVMPLVPLPEIPGDAQAGVEGLVMDLLGLTYDPPWDDAIPEEARRETPVGWSLETLAAWQCLEAAAEASERSRIRVALCVEAAWTASIATGYEAVVARVERDLIPWALGEGDPLRERVGE